jgi:acyl dehydratase
MTAEKTRAFTAADVADYLALVDDPSPRYRGANAIVPPPLLGGLISCLLGIELPGRGTNWLRQRYAFHHSVSPDEPVTGRVEIIRLRPDKALVNLRTECSTPLHGTVVSGEALVLVADLAR